LISFNKQIFLKSIFSKNNSKISSTPLNNKSHISINNFYSINDSDTNQDLSTYLITSSENLENKNFTCESIECFLKKNKKRFSNIPLFKDSILFQLEIFKELKNLKIENQHNLSKYELNVLKDFVKNKPFKVVELDKNIGSGIIDNSLYIELSEKILNDKKTYECLDINPLEKCLTDYEDMLYELLESKEISNKLFDALKSNNLKLGSFRTLPKLHKKKFSLRPIISYQKHITSLICVLIDCIIRPYVSNSETYIKDSQDFINKTKDLVVSLESIIGAGDFDSLYSNIEHSECLHNFKTFFKDKIDIQKNKHLSLVAFMRFLKFLLDNNYFTFNNKFYRQILGIAMGSICGPSIANLFVLLLERKWLSLNKPIVYLRFIDDIFFILLSLIQIESLKNAFGSLKLNIIIGDRVSFLDLEISLNRITLSLYFRVYTKPTNTFCYLDTKSNHPKHIFKNIIKSTLIRYRRICSSLSDFLYFASIVSRQFQKRGYDLNSINKTIRMVANLDRLNLIKYKERNKKFDENTFIFKTEFDKNIVNINEIIKNSFSSLKNISDLDFLSNKNLKIINSTQNNLISLLVHNLKFPNIIKNSFKKCENKNCNTCLFANLNISIPLNNNFNLPIINDSTCSSKNAIYIIQCKLCNCFYIGQTKCIKNRIYNHIYKIKTFLPFSNSNSCVSIHFNQIAHNFLFHFNFFILKCNIEDTDERLNVENFIINLFLKFNVKIINDFIPSINNFKKIYLKN